MLPSCPAVTSLNHLRQLHARAVVTSLHTHNYWVALLLRHCTHLHAPSTYTHLIFRSSDTPNVFVFTNLLKYYSSLGDHRRVLNLFDEMRALEVAADPFVYPILIKAADKDLAFAIHGHVVKLGHGSDRVVRNAVLGIYVRYGPVELLRKVFEEMPDRAVADWNAMITGYWKWGRVGEALLLFDAMPDKNVVTWTAMVTGYSSIDDLKTAKWLFDAMPEKNVVSWNAMLSAYAKKGLAVETLTLFDVMLMDRSLQPDQTTWVTVISACSMKGDLSLAEALVRMLDRRSVQMNYFVKTALIDMYAKCGSLIAARKIFEEMGLNNKNVVAWNAMISAYMRVGDLTSARELFDRMTGRNVVSWNSVIAGYAQNGQSAHAIEIFKEMIASGDSKPDEVTMTSIISACGHLGALEEGHWVVTWLRNNHIKLSINGENSLIFMYSKCGSIRDAQKIFKEMVVRDVVSYNTLIAGFAAYGRGAEAVRLMSQMKEEKIEPDRVTFIGVLTACSHAGLIEEGINIFESIRDPAIDHYACAVDLLGRAGRLDEALGLVDRMPMEPHAGVYGSLLNASRIHKRVELGELAAKKLFELEPENSGNYVLLSNLYATAGRWKDVDWTRQTMRGKGVKKTTACSWVEFGGKMHKFIVGDRSHEKSDDIYRLLTELKKRMCVLGYTVDKGSVLRDVEEEEKEEMVGTHSEKLAVGFALLVSKPGTVVRVVKNLRICWDCHAAISMISKLEGREIIVRDNNRFHCFSDGQCSCRDYW